MDRIVDDDVALGQQLGELGKRARLVGLHQLAVANHVGGKDRC